MKGGGEKARKQREKKEGNSDNMGERNTQKKGK